MKYEIGQYPINHVKIEPVLNQHELFIESVTCYDDTRVENLMNMSIKIQYNSGPSNVFYTKSGKTTQTFSYDKHEYHFENFEEMYAFYQNLMAKIKIAQCK